jgi:hypothetical protein
LKKNNELQIVIQIGTMQLPAFRRNKPIIQLRDLENEVLIKVLSSLMKTDQLSTRNSDQIRPATIFFLPHLLKKWGVPAPLPDQYGDKPPPLDYHWISP